MHSDVHVIVYRTCKNDWKYTCKKRRIKYYIRYITTVHIRFIIVVIYKDTLLTKLMN